MLAINRPTTPGGPSPGQELSDPFMSTTASVIWPRYLPSATTSAAMANRVLRAVHSLGSVTETAWLAFEFAGTSNFATSGAIRHSGGATSATSIFIADGL